MDHFTLVDTDILIDVGRKVDVAVKRLEAEEQDYRFIDGLKLLPYTPPSEQSVSEEKKESSG